MTATGFAEQGYTSHRDHLPPKNQPVGDGHWASSYVERKRGQAPSLPLKQIAEARRKLRLQRLRRRRRERIIRSAFALVGSICLFLFFSSLIS